jgi:hypothetical protein
MTGKHYRWQKRWAIDVDARKATHETGLVVAFECAPHEEDRPRGQALNAAETLAALIPKHGGGNAPIMLRRLAEEADRLYSTEYRDDKRITRT